VAIKCFGRNSAKVSNSWRLDEKFGECASHLISGNEIKSWLSESDWSTKTRNKFPAFLPGVESGNTFVFADTLGFHAVGMVADCDKEPKASVAILARALGESEAAGHGTDGRKAERHGPRKRDR
jgi:hypothetical protein